MKFSGKLYPDEIIYKRLYLQQPEQWGLPVLDWKEVRFRCQKYRIEGCPEKEPSPIGTVFHETDFFGDVKNEVRIFRHARYCPPFLHYLDFFKIIYVAEGSASVYLNGQWFLLKEGNVCIVTPDVTHTVFSCTDDSAVFNILIRRNSFAGAFSSILSEQNVVSNYFWKILYTEDPERILFFRCQKDERLDFMIEKMEKEEEKGPEKSTFLLKHYVIIFLGIIMRSHADQCERAGNAGEDNYILPSILRYIQDHLDSCSLKDTAAAFHMTESLTRNYIIQESGYSFQALVKKLRMEKASRLLTDTSMTVESAAEICGFINVSNFYREFRQYYGTTPSDYRMEEKNKNTETKKRHNL